MAGSPSVALRRARILHPMVDVAAELGRVDLAHAAAEELAHIAETFGTATLRATAAYAKGIELLATGEPSAASGPLRTGRPPVAGSRLTVRGRAQQGSARPRPSG